MRREGRVQGKPTNKSRLTGRCRMGKTRCRSCRDHPVEKSLAKTKGKSKRFAANKHFNSQLAEFVVDPLKTLQISPGIDSAEELFDVEEVSDFYNADVGSRNVISIYSMIEAIFLMQCNSKESNWKMDERVDMASIHEGAGDSSRASAPGDEALERVMEAYESSVKSICFHYSNTLSEGSWSDVEFSETEEENSVDDDWSLVDYEVV